MGETEECILSPVRSRRCSSELSKESCEPALTLETDFERDLGYWDFRFGQQLLCRLYPLLHYVLMRSEPRSQLK